MKGRFKPKGRQIDSESLAEINALLPIIFRHVTSLSPCISSTTAIIIRRAASGRPCPSDAPANGRGAASFYDHFPMVKEGEMPPPARTIRICTSLSCMMAGANQLLAEAKKLENPEVHPSLPLAFGAILPRPLQMAMRLSGNMIWQGLSRA